MGGGGSKIVSFFNDVAGAVGDVVDDTVTAANMVGGYIEDGFDSVVNYAEDIVKLGGMLLADTLNAAKNAGKKYFNALVREARRKAALIENSAKQAAQIAQDSFNDSINIIEKTANSAGKAIENQGKNIGNVVTGTANNFAKEMESTANTIKDGIVDSANIAASELEDVVDDTVSIAEDGLNFLISQDWFNIEWAQDFLRTLSGQFDRLKNIKFVSKSKKKASKKELITQNPDDPSSTSKINGYKEEPELIDKDGNLTFSIIDKEQVEGFSDMEKRFNKKKINILILLLVLILLILLNCMNDKLEN